MSGLSCSLQVVTSSRSSSSLLLPSVFLGVCVAVVLPDLVRVDAAVPDAARKASSPTDGSAATTVGAKKFAATSDCAGAVAFSGAGLRAQPSKAGDSTPLAFRALTDKGVGWSTETGEFTCYCPGLYQIAFAGDASSKLMLKRKPSSGSWSTVVSGSNHVVLLDMEIGDKVAVFLEGGSLAADSTASPIASFSGFRIAKKQ